MRYDPTDEPRGYHKYPVPTRRLRRFEHRNNTNVPYGRTRAVDKVRIIKPSRIVSIKHKPLRANITEYIAIADRVGLNPTNVANLYRDRANNGYCLSEHDVDIQFNSTFRGGDN